MRKITKITLNQIIKTGKLIWKKSVLKDLLKIQQQSFISSRKNINITIFIVYIYLHITHTFSFCMRFVYIFWNCLDFCNYLFFCVAFETIFPRVVKSNIESQCFFFEKKKIKLNKPFFSCCYGWRIFFALMIK